MGLFVNFRLLNERAENFRQQFRKSRPFSHVVIDNFLWPSAAAIAEMEFPTADSANWRREIEVDSQGRIALISRLACNQDGNFGNTLRGIAQELNSHRFVRYVERLTSVSDLVSGPKMLEGGLDRFLPDGELRVREDASQGRREGLCRRVNLLLHLNSRWQAIWGGELQFWDEEMQSCVERIAPVTNRCVIFTTSEVLFPSFRLTGKTVASAKERRENGWTSASITKFPADAS
jgi:hypothetical protein